MTPSPAPSLTDMLQAAVQHHQTGRLAEAESLYRQVLEAEPQNCDALHLLGVIAHQRGQYEAAIGMIQRAIALKPAAEFYNNCGEAYRALGRQEEAIARYQKAVALNPGFALAHYNLGMAHHAQGQIELAQGCYERTLALAPTLAETHYRLGQIHAAQGALEKATFCFEKAVQHNPASAAAHFELGNVLQQRGRLDEAIPRYQKALELKPEFPEALNNLGNVFQAQDKLDDAIACYAKAIRLRPDYVMAHNNLANVLITEGRLEAAVVRYHRVLELKPDFAEVHYNLGNALRELGKLDEAVESYERALVLKPDYVDARYNIGMIHRELGMHDEALRDFREVLSCNPDYSQAHFISAVAMQEQGKIEEAISIYQSLLGIPCDYRRPIPDEGGSSISPVSDRKQPCSGSPATIATSIAPKNIQIQRRAVDSWRRNGFRVVSINSQDEINILAPSFPDVEFVVAHRDARAEYGKPFIYFDDVLQYFKNHADCEICGIVNSDIHFLGDGLQRIVREEARDSFLFGCRVEIPGLETAVGEVYSKGYDYFFFDRKLLAAYPEESFCLGLPWWDYWAVLMPILCGFNVKKIATPIGYHVTHPINWNDAYWKSFGLVIARHIGASKPVVKEGLGLYDQYIWTLIEARSQKISMPNN